VEGLARASAAYAALGVGTIREAMIIHLTSFTVVGGRVVHDPQGRLEL